MQNDKATDEGSEVDPELLAPIQHHNSPHAGVAEPPNAAQRSSHAGMTVTQLNVAYSWSINLDIPVPRLGDNFLMLGGDSLAALAVSKNMVECSGGDWPEDGMVSGALAACNLIQHPVLEEYAAFLEASGVTAGWAAPHRISWEGLDNDGEEGLEERAGEHLSEQAASKDDVQKYGALRDAAASGRLDVVIDLLAAGVLPDGVKTRKDGEGVPAIHVAAGAGKVEIVKILLDAGAKVNGKMFFYKRAPAHCAAAAGQEGALQSLIERGAAVRAKDKGRMSVLHHAARGGSVACVLMVLESQSGASGDLKARDKWGRSPLHWAILNGHAAVASILIQNGADVRPQHMPNRIQRRRTTLEQPESLSSLAKQVLPADHEMHALLLEAEKRG